MAAPANCDDRSRIMAVMGGFQYPAWVPIPPNQMPMTHPPCAGNRLLCQIKRVNNERHPVPPQAPQIANIGIPTTRNRTVCDFCHTQGHAMAGCDRWSPPGPLGVAGFLRGTEAVFRENGVNNVNAVLAGVPIGNLQLGAHWLGKLCTLCENTEIQRYHERRFGGARRQTAARAANTCKCEKFLSKRLCYQDRVTYLFDIEHKSGRNAAWLFSWLEWLHIDPNDGRLKWATPLSPVRRAWIALQRTPATGIERNACRCGADVHTANVGYTNDTPSPAAMCTACNGIIIDVNHPRVTGWADTFPSPPTLPQNQQGNLKLGRRVEEF